MRCAAVRFAATQMTQAPMNSLPTPVTWTDPERERVFERFVRASDVGQGCGLGLAIVKEIVERHHGEVQLDTVQPHGLCVSIRLPLSPNSAN